MGPLRNPGLIELFFVNRRRDPALTHRQADARLRRLVALTYAGNAFYRQIWDRAGFDVRSFRGRQDLPRLPMVDKSMLVDAGEAAHTRADWARAALEMRTSGTSGRGIHIVRGVREQRVMRRSVLRHLFWLGLKPWDRTATIASGWLARHKGAFMKRIARTVHIEPQTALVDQVQMVSAFQPRLIMGQTGGIYLLARELLRRGQSLAVHAVVPTGATLMPEMRRAMEQAFGVNPCDLYGAIEVGPIAVQCRLGSYHIEADRIIVEIVDDAGRPVPPGESGQVVVTNLHSCTMPFIRYRLLDIASLGDGGCGCRSRFPLLGPVQGRINDFLPTPAGDLVSPHFFFHLFDDLPRNPVKEWRIVQEAIDRLVYEYVPEEGAASEAVEHGVRRIRERFGAACVVESREVAALPMTPEGKRRCILSKLRPQTASLEEVWARPPMEPAGV